MRIEWTNDGNADENGDFEAAIIPEQTDLQPGNPNASKQVFTGKSHKEVADKLLVAQVNATQKIREMSKPAPVETPAAAPRALAERKPLDADEMFMISEDMRDPAKAPAAVRRIVEAEVGAPVERIREVINNDARRSERDQAIAAAVAFQKETPDYYHCGYNAMMLVKWCQARKADLTKENFTAAFNELYPQNLLVEKPAGADNPDLEAGEQPGADPQPTGNTQQPGGLPAQSAAVTRRPRVVSSTGVRSGDSSGTRDARLAAPKYTREDIDRMSEADYSNKLVNEPGFRELITRLYEPKPVAR